MFFAPAFCILFIPSVDQARKDFPFLTKTGRDRGYEKGLSSLSGRGCF
jgi:hypothetical protein